MGGQWILGNLLYKVAMSHSYPIFAKGPVNRDFFCLGLAVNARSLCSAD